MLDTRTPYTMRIKGSKAVDIVVAACFDEENRLCYYDLERGHMLDGKTKKELPSGIVFESVTMGEVTLKPLTLKEFDELVRPWLDEYESSKLQTLNDIYFWYRRQAGIV